MKIGISLLPAKRARAAFAITPTQETAFIGRYKRACELRYVKSAQAMLSTKAAEPKPWDFSKTLAPEFDTRIRYMTWVSSARLSNPPTPARPSSERRKASR